MPDGGRPMTEADIEAAATVQIDAFGGVLADAVERYHGGARYSWRDGWVVELDGQIRAAAVAIKTRWWFRGVAYPISAVAGVAVRDMDRRQGHASALVRHILQADLAAGRPYSLLYPFQHGFYRRLGYASVGLANFWRIPIANLSDDAALRRRVRQVEMSDRPAVAELFSRSLREDAGGLERNAAQWAQRWARQDERWVLFDDRQAQGYLAYRPAQSTLEVRELVAETPQAERGLWAFMAAQVEQRSSISYLAPLDQPLWPMLREPVMFEATNRGFIINDVAALTMSFMARIVDISAALQAYSYAPEVTGHVRLDVRDPVLAGAEQSFEVHLADGHARVEPGRTEPDARCDIVTLSQLWTGALSATHARRYGQLEADDATVALLDRALFAGPPFIRPADWF